jgi:methionyl-tRNA formyltransferase
MRSPAGKAGPVEPVATVFFGSGAFAVPILEAVSAHPLLRIVGVVTAPDRPTGRGGAITAAPVARRARELGLPLLQPPRLRDPGVVEAIAALQPRLGVVADYGQLIPSSLLDLPALGMLNLHPSLLPRHRGASPIPATILAGDREAGVTVMSMDPGLDTGPIVASERWTLAGTESAPELEARAATEAAALLTRILPRWLAGEIRARPQGTAGVTLTRPLHRIDGQLDGARPAAELERRVRAFAPWPGTYIETPDERAAVHGAAVGPAAPGDRPGELVPDGRGIALATVDGRLVLHEVQPAGRGRMSGEAWRRGRPGIVGTTVVAAREASSPSEAAGPTTPRDAG